MQYKMLRLDEIPIELSIDNITVTSGTRHGLDNPRTSDQVPLIISYVILMLIGVISNCWVASVIIRILKKPRHTNATTGVQIYILALCFFDLIGLSFLIVVLLDLAYGRWMIPSDAVCQLFLCSESLNKFCAPFILTCMSGYCYFTVCCSNKAKSSRRGSATVLSLAFGLVSWEVLITVITILFCVVLVFILIIPVYMYGGIHYIFFENTSKVLYIIPKCAFHPPEHIYSLFTWYSFVLGYLLPGILFTFFYTAVLCRVRRRHSSATGDAPLYFWRVAKICMILVFFFFLCWTPFWGMTLYSFMYPVTSSSSFERAKVFVNYFVHMLPYINCIGYPILYTLFNRNIKAAYNQIKEERRRRRREQKIQKSRSASRNFLTPNAMASGSSIDPINQFFDATVNLMQSGMITFMGEDGRAVTEASNEEKQLGRHYVGAKFLKVMD